MKCISFYFTANTTGGIVEESSLTNAFFCQWRTHWIDYSVTAITVIVTIRIQLVCILKILLDLQFFFMLCFRCTIWVCCTSGILTGCSIKATITVQRAFIINIWILGIYVLLWNKSIYRKNTYCTMLVYNHNLPWGNDPHCTDMYHLYSSLRMYRNRCSNLGLANRSHLTL